MPSLLRSFRNTSKPSPRRWSRGSRSTCRLGPGPANRVGVRLSAPRGRHRTSYLFEEHKLLEQPSNIAHRGAAQIDSFPDRRHPVVAPGFGVCRGRIERLRSPLPVSGSATAGGSRRGPGRGGEGPAGGIRHPRLQRSTGARRIGDAPDLPSGSGHVRGHTNSLGPPQPAPYEGDLLQGKGVYVVHQTFERPGFYSATVQARKGALASTTTAAFQVLAADPTPAIGGAAPRTRNATRDMVADISTIDTGVPPDDMHYISVADAIAAHHAVVVYFGSPGFCRSRTCGPEVDVVKSLEARYRAKGVDFVHIETYKGGRPDNSDVAKATTSPWFDEWQLTSDPWVFVVDAGGNVAAKFDGPAAPDEIEPAIAAVAPK